MSLPPVELAIGGQICKKNLRHIFLKNKKLNNIKNKKSHEERTTGQPARCAAGPVAGHPADLIWPRSPSPTCE